MQQGAQQGMHGGPGVAAAGDYGRRQSSSFFGAAESAVGRLSGIAPQFSFVLNIEEAYPNAMQWVELQHTCLCCGSTVNHFPSFPQFHFLSRSFDLDCIEFKKFFAGRPTLLYGVLTV